MYRGICIGIVASASAVASAGTTFGNEANFVSQLQHFSLNPFNGVVAGPSGDLSYSIGGFSYDITTELGLGLFNDTGVVSTTFATDSLRINFTSGNVTAVGMNVWGTDINFNQIAAHITAVLSDGSTVSFNSNSVNRFGGYTSNMVITSLIISADDPGGLVDVWPTIDNIYVGSIVPLPAAGWAGLGMLGLLAGGSRVRRGR